MIARYVTERRMFFRDLYFGTEYLPLKKKKMLFNS